MVVVVAQLNADHDSALGVGHEKNILKRLLPLFSLVGSQPLLKECGEGVAVECVACQRVGDGQLSVALQGKFGQPLPPTIPTWRYTELVKVNMLFVTGACEDVVQS